MKLFKRIKKNFRYFIKSALLISQRIIRILCLSVLGVFILYPTGLPEPRPVSNDYAEFSNGTIVDIPFESFVYINVDSTFPNSEETMTVSASGIVIKTLNTDKTYILTAGHACEPLMVVFGPSIGETEDFENDSSVVVYDYFGFRHDASIVGIDYEDDLCLLSSDDKWNDGLPISRHMPRTGEKAYSIAAPRSIFSPGNALLFDGYFSGLDTTLDAYFTIPARPGSSGAGIINDEGHIVGIIHSAAADFENLSIASPVHDIEMFLSNYIIYVSAY